MVFGICLAAPRFTKRRRARLAIVAMTAFAAVLPGAVHAGVLQSGDGATVTPAITQADHRCFFGTGIQVWQDANKGGPTAIFCGTHFGRYSSTNYWDNLSYNADQLSNGANWNDRISSFEIFNTGDGGTHYIKFCQDTSGGGTCSATYTTSVYVSYVGNTLNDQITSIVDDGS